MSIYIYTIYMSTSIGLGFYSGSWLRTLTMPYATVGCKAPDPGGRTAAQRAKKTVSKRFVVSSGSPWAVMPRNEVTTETKDKVATGMGQLPRTSPAQWHFIIFFTKIWQVSQVFSWDLWPVRVNWLNSKKGLWDSQLADGKPRQTTWGQW